MAHSYRIRRTTIYCLGLVGFLVGLGLARLANPPPGWWMIIGLSSAFWLGGRGARSVAAVVCICCCGWFGWWRGGTVMQQVWLYDNLVGQQVVIEATVLEDAVYGQKGQLTFAAGSMRLRQPNDADLIGEIDVAGSGTSMAYRGDRVLVSGKLFRKRGGQIVGMSYARINVVRRGSSPIETFRRQFASGLQDVLPEQLASFGLGLLIGQRSTIDEKLSEDLVTVGLIHIVAVSGYNLTVIIMVVRKLFRRSSRFQTLFFSVSLIAAFLLLTGFSPSIIRAAVVSTLSLGAWFYGRAFKPVLLLLAVAALTAGINPLYLWSNIGWYLSFTAFYGVLVLGPLLQARCIPSTWQDRILPAVFTETVSAQLCTVPIILYIFGRLSIISIVANVLVVPLTPLAMLLSALAGVSGMSHFVFAAVIAIPAKAVLGYMLDISSLLARVPLASIGLNIDVWSMVGMYASILGLVAILHVKVRDESVIITETEEYKRHVRT